MPRGTDKTMNSRLRALLVLAALVSLCVSDTVGVRLLPLTGDVTSSTTTRQSFEDAAVTSAPSSETSGPARVTMAAPARKSVGAEHRSAHVAARAAEEHVTPPSDAGAFSQTTHSPLPASPPALTRPPGRAPPPSH